MTFEPRKQRRFWNRKMLLAILLILAVTVAGGAAIMLPFTHKFPVIPKAAVLETTCSDLTPSYTSVVATPASILFTCNSDPALTVQTTGSATPTFDLTGTGESDLALVDATQQTRLPNCNQATTTPVIFLHSGTPVSFTAGQQYDYCNTDPGPVPAAGYGSFNLDWA